MCPSTDVSASERATDPLWGVLVGTYLGLLGAPLAVFGAVRLGVESAGVLYGTAVAAFTVAIGVGWAVTERWPRLSVSIGATRLRWLPAAVPVPYALSGFASLSTTGVSGVLAFFFGLGATVVGLVLGVMARTRHTDAVLDGVETECAFRAGWPAAARKRLGLAAGVVTAVAGACFLGGLLGDWFALQLAGQLLLPLGAVTYSSTEDRDYTVSAVGLEQRLPVARRVTPWDGFDGYTRTGDALILHRSWRVDVRLALADLEAPETVEAAIARYLPASGRRD